MDPGWPYAYNRLVAATSGQSAGNFAHISAGGSVPGIVQPTATVPGTVNPYGSTSFLPPPPTVGYDVFSTLFHPHAAQVGSPAAVNLKTLNYSIDGTTPGRSSAQQESSNASTISSSNSSPQQTNPQGQQAVTQQQFTYQNTSSISRPTANVSWNAANSASGSSNSGGGQASHQQLQFGLIPNSVSSSTVTSNPPLATITRVNSNGCTGTATVSTPSAIYDYNAQLKAHPLYQLNSHLANAAVMAMANKLNANRTTITVPLASSPANSNNGSSCSGTSSSTNNGSSGNSYSSSNDREKTQIQQQSQDYANHSANKSSHINAASTVAAASPSPSNSASAIPLIQFEAARLQQQLQLQQQQHQQQQQQQQQHQAAKESVQQSSPISYSMWANNSPIQNKFNSCEVAQQQHQQQQHQQHIQQQISRRPPIHSPNPVQSAFTRQSQQPDVSIRPTNHGVPNTAQQTQAQQQQQHLSNQDALYINHRANKNSSASVEYGNSPSGSANSQTGALIHGDHQSSRNQSNAIVVPRRPSPMQISQASPIGQSAPSPAYPIYNSPMNANSQVSGLHPQQPQYSSNNNSRDSSSADGHYQVNPSNKTRDGPSNTYSSVITRVAGGNTWETPMANKSSPGNTTPVGGGGGGMVAGSQDSRLNKAPKKRRSTGQEAQESGSATAADDESNRTTWQHQLHLLGNQAGVKSPYESPSISTVNGSSGHSINRSALAHQHQEPHLHSQSSSYASGGESWRNEEEQERRRTEVARSQVVVPDIMEELNFLAADTTKSSSKKPTSNSQRSANGRVQIISVEATGKPSDAGGQEDKALTPITPVNAKKPDEKGFIGSYLKFLQGDTNPLGVTTIPSASKQRRVAGAVGQTQPKKRNNSNAQKQAPQASPQPQTQQGEPPKTVQASDAAKKTRTEMDEQGYVPNGGASAFDPNYQQPLHQQPYQQQYMHPLSIAGAHFQGQVPTNAVGGAQMLAHQAYAASGAEAAPPVTDGFNYFDLQFRPRW